MTPLSSVRPSPRFERLASRLTDEQPQEFAARYAEAIEILRCITNRGTETVTALLP